MKKAFFVLLMAGALLAGEINVPGVFVTIQEAIDGAHDGDTVLVAEGDYHIDTPINFRGKAIIVKAAGQATRTRIIMSVPLEAHRGSVVVFEGGEGRDSVLDGFSIASGEGTLIQTETYGGGVLFTNGASPTVRSCRITDNTCREGGAIACIGADPLFVDCTMTGNQGDLSGAVYCEGASPEFRQCRIENHECRGSVVRCVDHASPVFDNVTVQGNKVSGTNGSIMSCSRFAAPQFIGCQMSGNSTVDGHTVYCRDNTDAILVDCTMTGNNASGIYCNEQSDVQLSRCNISSNLRRGVVCRSSAPAISDCVIRSNKRGGISIGGPSTPVFLRCQIVGNEGNEGGGILVGSTQGESMFANCLIAGNFGHAGGGGGYLYRAQANFVNCTFAGNKTTGAYRGGGLYAEESTLKLRNCIVRDNEGIGGSILGSDWTLIADHSCLPDEETWEGPGNIRETPRFESSGEYDFSRFQELTLFGDVYHVPDFVVNEGDYRLQYGSPCIDAGTVEDAPLEDILGQRRACNEVDMGAYELCELLYPVFIRGDANADGAVQLSDAIYIASYLFCFGPEPPCMKAADVNDNSPPWIECGKPNQDECGIDLTDVIYLLCYLFADVQVLPEPFMHCGVDTTDDSLSCEAHDPCAL